MCCCPLPNKNGQPGYRWNNPDGPTSVYPVNPPALADGDTLLCDEPGRCGGLDSHSHHYRLVLSSTGGYWLFVRHGAGDEHIRLSNGLIVSNALALLTSDARYWMMGAIFHAQSHAARDARYGEHERWKRAFLEKRIKTRKHKGYVTVTIEPKVTEVSA